MKTKRRFTSEEEILKAIELCHVRAKANLVQADWHEDEAKRLFKLSHEKELEWEKKGGKRDPFRNEFQEVWQLQDKGKTELSLMEACRKRARNLIDKKAKRLGDKLSQFRTELLHFQEKELRPQDHSIPVA
jgi:hypothetical protein